jgi:hypothetical protein
MPASNALVRTILSAVIGVVIGGGAVAYSHKNDATSAAGSRATGVASSDARDELDALGADVARLKTNAPSQSHTTSDVGFTGAISSSLPRERTGRSPRSTSGNRAITSQRACLICVPRFQRRPRNPSSISTAPPPGRNSMGGTTDF